MASIDRSALVLHSAEQMFCLVNDVRRYPEFLSGCRSTELISESDTELVARLHLSKGGLSYSFATRNQLFKPERMLLTLEEGPFSSLSGEWQFLSLSEEACKVVLHLEFEFANKVASLAMGKLFSQVAATLVDSFVQRADQVYGEGSL